MSQPLSFLLITTDHTRPDYMPSGELYDAAAEFSEAKGLYGEPAWDDDIDRPSCME